MFSLKVVDTDAFLDMPQTCQLLYYSLAMRADDDGFIANPKKIMRMLGSQEDDYKILIAKKFIIPFESGICVIKHWLIHNLIRGDRYSETQYTKEKSLLFIDEKTRKYSLNKGENYVIPDDNPKTTQYRLGKVSIGKDREETTPSKEKSINYLKEIPEEDISKFLARFDMTSKELKSKAESLSLYCQSKGRVYKDYRAFLLNALKKDFKEKSSDGKVFIQGVGWTK